MTYPKQPQSKEHADLAARHLAVVMELDALRADARSNMYISQLEADYAAALRDARRYRQWREGGMSIACWNIVRELCGEELDEALDAIEADENKWLAAQRPQKVINRGMRDRDQVADSPIRGTAAGLNAQRYKPGRE